MNSLSRACTCVVPFAELHQLVSNSPQLPAHFRVEPSTGANILVEYKDPEADIEGFVFAELSTHRLDLIVDWLWVAGVPHNIRPLHQQKALGRAVILVEDISLHLVWAPKRVFIKPLPGWLLHYQSYEKVVLRPTNQKVGLDCHNAQRMASGLLKSYSRLIVHESDFVIALESGLLPKTTTYSQWVAFARSINAGMHVCNIHSKHVMDRYRYGELRLGRINLLYRFLPRFRFEHLARGYFTDVDKYSTFLQNHFRWMLLLYANLNIVLGGLQVAVQTTFASSNESIQRAAWGLSQTSLLLVATGIVAVIICLCLAFTLNALFAWQAKRGRLRVDESSQPELGGHG